MESEVVIRLADEHDLDAIAAFGAVVVPAHYEPIIGRAAAQEQVDLWWTRQRLQAALSNGALLVAEEGAASRSHLRVASSGLTGHPRALRR